MGDGGKHTLLPEEKPCRTITVWGNYCELFAIDREYACHYGGEDNNEADSNALFSSVTAATELGVNSFKSNFESRTTCYHFLGVGQQVGRGAVGCVPEQYVCALHCNTAILLQLCFLRAWNEKANSSLYYNTSSELQNRTVQCTCCAKHYSSCFPHKKRLGKKYRHTPSSKYKSALAVALLYPVHATYNSHTVIIPIYDLLRYRYSACIHWK